LKNHKVVEPYCSEDGFEVRGDWSPILYSQFFISNRPIPEQLNFKSKGKGMIAVFIVFVWKGRMVEGIGRFYEAVTYYSHSNN
jgi:hypothetical protein